MAGPPHSSPPRPPSFVPALVANIVALLFCFVPAVVGIVLAIVAGQVGGSRPDGARTLLVVSWVCCAMALLAFLLLAGFFFLTQPESTLGVLGLI